jgi:hypothetical protein
MGSAFMADTAWPTEICSAPSSFKKTAALRDSDGLPAD